MNRVLLFALAALCAATGCVHTSTRARSGGFAGIRGEPDSNEFGIVVNVFADGRLELFGRRYDRDGLVAKLIDVQGGLRSDDSRMIVLKGHEGVTPRDLESLHEFLVTRHLYRISVETPRTASATGIRFRPILPEGGLQAQDLSPDDPLVKQLFGDE